MRRCLLWVLNPRKEYAAVLLSGKQNPGQNLRVPNRAKEERLRGQQAREREAAWDPGWYPAHPVPGRGPQRKKPNESFGNQSDPGEPKNYS